jgi:hypothetical protein
MLTFQAEIDIYRRGLGLSMTTSDTPGTVRQITPDYLVSNSAHSYDDAIQNLIFMAQQLHYRAIPNSKRRKNLYWLIRQLTHELGLRRYWASFSSISTSHITNSDPITDFPHLGMMFCGPDEAHKSHSIYVFNYPLGKFYYWYGTAHDYFGSGTEGNLAEIYT